MFTPEVTFKISSTNNAFFWKTYHSYDNIQVKENPYLGIFSEVKPDKIDSTSLKQAKGNLAFESSSSEKELRLKFNMTFCSGSLSKNDKRSWH